MQICEQIKYYGAQKIPELRIFKRNVLKLETYQISVVTNCV